MIGLIACVAAGGAAGTLLRFGVSQWVNGQWPQHSHLAILLVNLVGCLLIGYLYGLFLSRPDIPLEVRAGLTVGVLGGLTTFSTFSLDTLRLLEAGQPVTAFCYLACSVLGGLMATWAGLSFARL